ncbi:dihydrofolate reductase family protein [Micromonospora yasonensis]|uniref:dihydrofolate reductase family protein n=1 Tax=Micromonospora yasonensis TaxID=1128667 RepID=UPI0022302E3B|nr:dihydrofolate reductase family protein [Micromonospora yasonensis]MCW3838632.1 dihydrofolate reductase family protein [Micromonospora yasonensis]
MDVIQATELTWSGSHRLDGDLATAVGELKSRPGGELQVHGSGVLAQSLMREGLIDTYHLLIFPVVLGRGRRLFAEGVPPAGLRLTDTRTSGSGVTMLTYDSAGVPTFGTVGA